MINVEDRRKEKVNLAIDDFGRVVRDYRLSNFHTLEEMAGKVGLSTTYVYRIERYKRSPNLESRLKILFAIWGLEDVHLYIDELFARKNMD